jgi:hypothetical protein
VLDVSDSFPKRRGHWLVVSNVPEGAYGKAALDSGVQHIEWVGPRALAHESVIEHFIGAPAVLPMQLFTLFANEERAIADIRAGRQRISRILDRIDGRVEWGIRLMWNPVTRERAARKRQPVRTVTGADYLVRKRDLRNEREADLKGARADANRVYRLMARKASKAVRRTATEKGSPGSRLLLDAAFLVRSRDVRGFQAAIRKERPTLERAGIEISVTGPWPAYNFV